MTKSRYATDGFTAMCSSRSSRPSLAKRTALTLAVRLPSASVAGKAVSSVFPAMVRPSSSPTNCTSTGALLSASPAFTASFWV